MTITAERPALTPAMRPYQPFGAARAVLYCRDNEVLLSGPAGTGKSRALLEKLHLCAQKYAGMRGLIVRKTRASLTQSALVTFERWVLPEGALGRSVTFHHEDQEYRYPNGSVIVVGGLDKASKIMSTEFDLIYVQEAIELTLDDWESLTTRLRNGGMPYQQIIADTNPDRPRHWLLQRAQSGRTTMIESRHEDNPRLFDVESQQWKPEGVTYIARLEDLTGARKQRLRYGRWVQAEGVVYDGFDRAVHVVPGFPVPPSWLRFWVIDFGYTNPFVWHEWVEDPDGRLYLHREMYMTSRLVQDHAEKILDITGWALRSGRLVSARDDAPPDPLPVAIICDHDAEDRATFERATGLRTSPAYKSVSRGIEAVAARLRPAGDGKPRLFLMADALVEVDEERREIARPYSTEQEFDGYVWDTSSNRRTGEQPLKVDDHSMDSLRYACAFADNLALDVGQADQILTFDDFDDDGYVISPY